MDADSEDGIPVAYHGFPFYVYYIINHLKFRVFIHGTKIREKPYYGIVGFEVAPCSIKRDANAMSKLKMYDRITPSNCIITRDERQEIEANRKVTFTYEVEFIQSNQSQWRAYFERGRQEVHFYLKMNSVIGILVVAGLTSFKIWRKPAKSSESLPLTNDGLSRSKLFLEVAFRESSCSKILCIMVGTGIQIAGMAIVSIVFLQLGDSCRQALVVFS